MGNCLYRDDRVHPDFASNHEYLVQATAIHLLSREYLVPRTGTTSCTNVELWYAIDQKYEPVKHQLIEAIRQRQTPYRKLVTIEWVEALPPFNTPFIRIFIAS